MGETFFSRVEPKFAPVPESGEILTVDFLNAAAQVIPFIELLGKAFTPVKSDIQQNITKLRRIYDHNPKNFTSFRPMLQDDIERNMTREGTSATISLLWLKRALHFIVLLLEQIVQDSKHETTSETIVPFCQVAYDEALKKYHGWLIQKVFKVLIKAAPKRKDLLKTLAFGDESLEGKVVDDMKEFVHALGSNIMNLQKMYSEMNLDFDDKV